MIMQTLDLNELFTRAWEVFARQIGMAIAWTLAYAVGTFILAISIIGLILLPVWVAGYLETMRAIWQGGTGEFGDFFKHIGKIGNLWVATILVGLCVFVGVLLFIIPGIILAVLWSQTILLIIDKDLDAITAMTASWNRVKDEFWMVLVILLIIQVIGALGGLVVFGWLFTWPFGALLVWAMYYALFPPVPRAAPVSSAADAPQPETPPPPPSPRSEETDNDEGIKLK
jgi:uncharacterized membrane protein